MTRFFRVEGLRASDWSVDGGVLSNYPIWLLDDDTSNPEWPTFGFKLTQVDNSDVKKPEHKPFKNVAGFLMSIGGTMMDAHDNYYISESRGDYERTIKIPNTIEVNGVKKKINTVDFDITREESRALFNNGLKAAEDFLSKWDFDAWKKKYRQ